MSSPRHRHSTSEEAARIAAADAQMPWQALEDLVHIDPAGRGLASFRRDAAPLDAGQLRAAALELAEHAAAVGIVTGFCVRADQGMTAETDGPQGALFLARALLALNVDVCLISDRYAMPLLEFGCDYFGLDRNILLDLPLRDSSTIADDSLANRWVDDFFAGSLGARLTHLVSIERPGPSHTSASLAAQTRRGPAPLARFEAAVPLEHRDVCHNMRGESIDAWTARTEQLFDAIVERRLPITTIGIGDGGNEIGMGRFPWELLVEAVSSSVAERIASRVAADFTIVGGVSDWAAYALALAVAQLRGQSLSGEAWQAAAQRRFIEQMIRQTPAVDGLTRRKEPTVDGLPLDVYLRPLEAMRTVLDARADPRS